MDFKVIFYQNSGQNAKFFRKNLLKIIYKHKKTRPNLSVFFN